MKLPFVIDRYLEAANRFDATEASQCFAPDAVVHDEGRDHVGRDAIRAWVESTSEKYKPRFEAKDQEVLAGVVRLSVMVTGTFPGSPIELEYRITLSDEMIAKLSIG